MMGFQVTRLTWKNVCFLCSSMDQLPHLMMMLCLPSCHAFTTWQDELMSCSFATGEKGVSLPPSTESANVDLFMTIENLFVTSVFMCVFVLCFFHSLVFFCPFYIS